MATHNKDIVKALSKRVLCLNKGQLMGEDGKKPKADIEHSEEKSAIINTGPKKSEEKSKETRKEEQDENF